MRTTLLLLVLALFCPTIHYGQVESNGEILLPAQRQKTRRIDPAQQASLSFSPAWLDFTASHGQWNVQWNPTTRTPHRAYGKAIPLSGYTAITTANVQQAASEFLDQNQEVIGVRTQNLKFLRATEANGRWYAPTSRCTRGWTSCFRRSSFGFWKTETRWVRGRRRQ